MSAKYITTLLQTPDMSSTRFIPSSINIPQPNGDSRGFTLPSRKHIIRVVIDTSIVYNTAIRGRLSKAATLQLQPGRQTLSCAPVASYRHVVDEVYREAGVWHDESDWEHLWPTAFTVGDLLTGEERDAAVEWVHRSLEGVGQVCPTTPVMGPSYINILRLSPLLPALRSQTRL